MTPALRRRLARILGTTALLVSFAACTQAAATSVPSVATTPAPSVASTACPTNQPSALEAGGTRTVTMATEKGDIVIKLEADLSPIAVGNFAALAACGYYDGIVIHRLVPGFVIQGGDPTGTGTGGPGYEIQDEPVTTTYHRGTVAMARSSQPNSVGSQFFIVLDDAAAQSLGDPRANNYQIIGTVTAGMDTVDAIAAMPNSGEPENMALDPVVMTTVTIANP